ncbi:hypothetical protein [Staphylococcus pseudoxylosus]|uniref:hypothetical protein n=1 Tax=Staphylococcus pseudoxylosus TaxID=2282419 RepID=UPI00298F42AD|nr:hypothetical protein [Staphylococcus pseudoxylosus]
MYFIIPILLSGAPGFVTYVILDKLNLINFTNQQNFEKSMTVTTFTVINAFFTILTLEVMNNYKVISTIIVSVLVMLILTSIIYPIIFKLLNKNFNTSKSDLNTLIRIMDQRPENLEHTLCYIFDYDNNLIASGNLDIVELQSSNLSIVYDRNYYDYQSVLKLYDQTKNLNKDIYIDFVNKIKIYLIHY